MAHLLAVDDERAILDLLRRVLERDGYEVDVTDDPTSVPGRDLSRYDLVLTDVMMPGLDGFELVRRIRDEVDASIVFLTAKVSEEDAVMGLGLGADDYLRKPFGAAELRAKVAAHLRREHRERKRVLAVGRVRFDLKALQVSVEPAERCANPSGTLTDPSSSGPNARREPEVVPLTPTEYDICEFLARHPGQVYSRPQIREAVLGVTSEVEDSAISVHVSNARAKLRAAGADVITTVWASGTSGRRDDEQERANQRARREAAAGA